MSDAILNRLRAQHTTDGALDDPEICDVCYLLEIIERLEAIVEAARVYRNAEKREEERRGIARHAEYKDIETRMLATRERLDVLIRNQGAERHV